MSDLYSWISPDKIVIYLLIVARMSGLFMVSPLLSNPSVPARVKLFLVIMMGFLIYPVAAPAKSFVVANTVVLAVYVLMEIGVGYALGFVSSIVFGVIQTAGDFFSQQLGYAIATIFDPNNQTDSGVITSLYTILGALIFLYLDGHHVILSGLAKSYTLLPLGSGMDPRAAVTMTQLVTYLTVISIQLAAPIIIVMTLLNVIMGLLSKISPQLNIYMNVGFVVGPVVGMIILAISLPLFRVVLTHMTEQLGPDMLNMVKSLKGV